VIAANFVLRCSNFPFQTNWVSVPLVYQHRTASVNDKLQGLQLLYDRQLLISTKVIELHDDIISAMQASSYLYSCTRPAQISSHAHENMSLTLLALRNRGNPRPSDNCIALKEFPVSGSLTLEDLLANRLTFANLLLCLEDGRFIVHFSE